MAPTKLKCTFGDTSCNFETQELEFPQAKELLETHLKFAHPAQGGNNDRRPRPESFPRPDLKLDSSAEEWSKFLNFQLLGNNTKLNIIWEEPVRSDSSLPVVLRNYITVCQELQAEVTLIKQKSSCQN